jgi:ribosomal protein S18 acetylase RimI-like enzyme
MLEPCCSANSLKDGCYPSSMPTPAPGFTVRPYRPEDLDALYDICLKTGDTGEDATALYDDPKLLGHLYAAPYATLEPDLTFVLEDSKGVCGYILGAFDSKTFYERLEREWFPALREQYVNPVSNPETWTRDEHLIEQFYESRPDDDALLTDYPSHLHIDLLPRAQGSSNGRALMETFLEALQAKGSPAVHLGTSPQNLRAEQFYKKMGFIELKRREPHTLIMGKRL